MSLKTPIHRFSPDEILEILNRKNDFDLSLAEILSFDRGKYANELLTENFEFQPKVGKNVHIVLGMPNSDPYRIRVEKKNGKYVAMEIIGLRKKDSLVELHNQLCHLSMKAKHLIKVKKTESTST